MTETGGVATSGAATGGVAAHRLRVRSRARAHVLAIAATTHANIRITEVMSSSGSTADWIEVTNYGSTAINLTGWKMDEVFPASELVRLIDAVHPLEAADANYEGEVARRYRYRDGQGEVGFITSVTQPFCGTCTRARLSADGSLYTCLFAVAGTDLRAPMRAGASDAELGAILDATWHTRTDRYSELRTADTTGDRPRVEMSYIGG